LSLTWSALCGPQLIVKFTLLTTEKMSEKPKLEGLTAVYSQDADTWDTSLAQEITIESHYVGEQEGKFYTIKTDRWAFDNIKELTDTLNDFIKRTK
jgi:hypothetical protein